MLRRFCSVGVTARRLYCPSTHVWLLPLSGSRSVRLGLTERGWDDVGDVVGTAVAVALQEAVAPGQPLLRIEWEALSISDGDELYHTNFAQVEGVAEVRSPVAATVAALNSEAEHGDDDAWLAELDLADAAALTDAALLDEGGYKEAVRRGPPGRFGEHDGESSQRGWAGFG